MTLIEPGSTLCLAQQGDCEPFHLSGLARGLTEVTTGDHTLILRYDRPVDRDHARRTILALIRPPHRERST